MYHEKDVVKNEWFIKRLITECNSRCINAGLITVEEYMKGCYSKLPDAVVARMINPHISKQLENKNIRVFNNSEISYICNNKAETMRFIHSLGINHIPTMAVYEKDGKPCYEYIAYQEMDIDRTKPEKYVIKSVTGHGGREVWLLSDFINKKPVFGAQEKNAAISYSDIYIVQPLIECAGRDMRVYIVGNEIIGAVLRQSETGFKSNYSLGGKVSLYSLNSKQKKIINKITENINIDYGGIDFLVCGEDDTLIFNEIEDVVGARMLSECSDIDYVKLYITHIYNSLNK